MAATLILTDYNSTIRVEYKTNLINDTDDAFTISEVVGLEDAEVIFGINFQRFNYTVAGMKAFALANGLKLQKLTNLALTTIQDFSGSTYYGAGLGSDGI